MSYEQDRKWEGNNLNKENKYDFERNQNKSRVMRKKRKHQGIINANSDWLLRKADGNRFVNKKIRRC